MDTVDFRMYRFIARAGVYTTTLTDECIASAYTYNDGDLRMYNECIHVYASNLRVYS